MSDEKRHLLNSLLEFLEQVTYLNQENQKIVTSGPCWHGIMILLLKTSESWNAASPPNLTHFLLQLVQVLINLSNDNASSCEEFITQNSLPALVCFFIYFKFFVQIDSCNFIFVFIFRHLY